MFRHPFFIRTARLSPPLKKPKRKKAPVHESLDDNFEITPSIIKAQDLIYNVISNMNQIVDSSYLTSTDKKILNNLDPSKMLVEEFKSPVGGGVPFVLDKNVAAHQTVLKKVIAYIRKKATKVDHRNCHLLENLQFHLQKLLFAYSSIYLHTDSSKSELKKNNVVRIGYSPS